MIDLTTLSHMAMNPEWIRTVNNFIYKDMQPNPNTEKVFRCFTNNALFEEMIDGKIVTVSRKVAEVVYKICCEQNCVAMGPMVNEISQTGDGENGYITWKLSGPQKRLELGKNPEGWYLVSGENRLYFEMEDKKMKICKLVIVNSSFTPIDSESADPIKNLGLVHLSYQFFQDNAQGIMTL